ncbi:LPS-assembly lipoprotein LptE [Agaribacter flavus]|uniref:LPS-assembly lipoprotein LptE n=1 Tax=Agaribacter flavus TaxID=1902781 RepID=A0ABV7FP84_9ALTE
MRVKQFFRAHTLSLFLVCLFLNACGFHLRGSQALPSNVNTVVISSALQYSPLSRSLTKRLPIYQLTGLTPAQAQERAFEQGQLMGIALQPENLERRLLSIFSSGQVAEYELIYSVDYEVNFSGMAPIKHTMTVTREYQEDPDRILAKSRELELIMEEMRIETADRMIRLLSSQYATAQIRE